MLTLDGVTVRYGSTTAVDDVSLDVEADETVVLLGPSGCGKSTLLRAVAGLEPLAAGTMVLDGRNLADVAPHERGIGLMFQDHALFPHRDVGDNIAFGLRMQRVEPGDRDRRVGELLDLVGLSGFERRAVATLSGGEAQRVALARSLAPWPRVLLLDEPLGSLDRRLRDRLVDELPDLLRAAGTAAIHVTHDHDEAFAVGDRLAVMIDGAVRRVGPPDDVWIRPVDRVVARFLGHTNIIEDGDGARMIRADAATVDESGELTVTVVRARFRAGTYDTVVTTVDGDDLRFVLGEWLEPGSSATLRIDPDRVSRLHR